jgi:heme O synthase-like polyprenyltransferase
VDVVATLLVGLIGGLVGGAAAMLGWTATTHRRRPRAAAST